MINLKNDKQDAKLEVEDYDNQFKIAFPPKDRHRTNPKSPNHISGLKSKINNYKTTS